MARRTAPKRNEPTKKSEEEKCPGNGKGQGPIEDQGRPSHGSQKQCSRNVQYRSGKTARAIPGNKVDQDIIKDEAHSPTQYQKNGGRAGRIAGRIRKRQAGRPQGKEGSPRCQKKEKSMEPVE
jgi:hypothetical protein